MIEGIQAITLSTDNPIESERFFADWGLKKINSTNHQPASDGQMRSPPLQVWETLNGARVNIVACDAMGYGTPIESGPTLREVVWAVETQQDLDEIAKRLEPLVNANSHFDDRRNDINQPSLKLLDLHGLPIAFVINAKRALQIVGSPSNAWGQTSRVDQASPIYSRAEPIEIGHVVLFTERLDEAEKFYASLGFITSDRYPGRGVFMRCSERGGHHDLFMLQIPGKKQGLNHIAFTVRDIHEVFGGGLHMDRCGWKTQLGPGRHPVSSAFFWYFENPCGGLIEYNADEDQLTGAWQAREFDPSPTAFAEWAVDSGLDGQTRRQKTGPLIASQKFLTEKR